MRSFEIFVDTPASNGAPQSGTQPTQRHFPGRRAQERSARDVIDVFIHGANVTARVSEKNAHCVLRDLAQAVIDLGATSHGKRIVRFYEEAWELCVERVGETAFLSVYQTGPVPHVLVYDRSVVFHEVWSSVDDAIQVALDKGIEPKPVAAELAHLKERFSASYPLESTDAVAAHEAVSIDLDSDAPLSFGADFTVRPRTTHSVDPTERTDLHALLFRGMMTVDVRGKTFSLGEVHPFLAAERLVYVARQTLDAWERGQPLQVRTEAGGLIIGVRLLPDGALSLVIGSARNRRSDDMSRAVYTFPQMGVADFVEASLGYARQLVRELLRRDRSQSANLRLAGFRRVVRETSDALRETERKDALVNEAPESYRAFFIHAKTERPTNDVASTRVRYTQKWRALVPSIDVRSTFLCGDRLVVGSLGETHCLERATGKVIWQVETHKATSVVTPGGIARISQDGALAVHDFGTGEVTLRSWLAPRLGGPSAGAVVNSPGLPQLLVVTEGERHLVAVDLRSGESRWRYAWGKRGTVRLKRAGKLLYVSCGDSALTALDVLTGSVVWRVRDRLRFSSVPAFDKDWLFTIAGGAASATHLHAIDPYEGRIRWTSEVTKENDSAQGCTVEGAPHLIGDTVVVLIRGRRGVRALGFDKETGALRYRSDDLAPLTTSWIVVDDLLIGNSPLGELIAFDAATGTVRYRHQLGRVLEADVPRRLEPVLRGGALFVPHTDIHVFRPNDGMSLGTIGPCDAIPDLLRVDERGDIYIAEESGHLVSFGVGARLSLVKG